MIYLGDELCTFGKRGMFFGEYLFYILFGYRSIIIFSSYTDCFDCLWLPNLPTCPSAPMLCQTRHPMPTPNSEDPTSTDIEPSPLLP